MAFVSQRWIFTWSQRKSNSDFDVASRHQTFSK